MYIKAKRKKIVRIFHNFFFSLFLYNFPADFKFFPFFFVWGVEKNHFFKYIRKMCAFYVYTAEKVHFFSKRIIFHLYWIEFANKHKKNEGEKKYLLKRVAKKKLFYKNRRVFLTLNFLCTKGKRRKIGFLDFLCRGRNLEVVLLIFRWHCST